MADKKASRIEGEPPCDRHQIHIGSRLQIARSERLAKGGSRA